MGTITVKVSDLTGEQISDETQLARLVVEGHPDFPEPVTLEVLPSEVEEQLPTDQEFVILSYYAPADPTPKNFLMPLDAFNNLFKQVDVTSALRKAFAAQEKEREGSRSRRRGGRRQVSRTRQRIDYTSPEHAGEPHRGTISEAEKVYVREHLDEVNARLREKGLREIDPADAAMGERYGLTQQPPADSEAGGEAAQSS